MEKLRPLKKYVFTAIGLVILAVFIFPVYWMIDTSIKPVAELFAVPPHFVPRSPTLQAYAAVVDPKILTNILNSFIVAAGTSILTLAFSTPLAYSLARLRIWGKALIMLFLLDMQMLPQIGLALPLFVIFSKIHLVNTRFGLILADTTFVIPFAVLTLRPFFLNVPDGLEDAAYIDGCSKWGAFWRVILPLMVPGFFTIGIFSFLMGWSDFVNALVLTTSADIQPLTMGIYTFIGQYEIQWSALMAVATVAAAPIVIIFIGLQRYVVAGIGIGALKE